MRTTARRRSDPDRSVGVGARADGAVTQRPEADCESRRRAQARAADDVVRMVDDAIRGRAVVLGSLPPHGRDIDLLVADADAVRISSAFRSEGLVARGEAWALFRGCAVVAVELARASNAALPPSELESLFASGTPVHGATRVVEPAPSHSLLLLARRLSGAGELEPKHRERISRALARDDGAWTDARGRAGAWGAEGQLARLESLYRDGVAASGRPVPRRPRWTRAVALSGAHAEDVLVHADALRDALVRLGYEAALVDSRPGASRDPGQPVGTTRRRVVESRTLLTFVSALTLWRHRIAHLGRVDVVVHAGHAAEHAVAISAGAAPGVTARAARRLRWSSPLPRRLYLLDRAEPHGSGDEEASYRAAAAVLGASTIDASGSASVVCELLARDVSTALGARGRLESTVRAAALGASTVAARVRSRRP